MLKKDNSDSVTLLFYLPIPSWLKLNSVAWWSMLSLSALIFCHFFFASFASNWSIGSSVNRPCSSVAFLLWHRLLCIMLSLSPLSTVSNTHSSFKIPLTSPSLKAFLTHLPIGRGCHNPLNSLWLLPCAHWNSGYHISSSREGELFVKMALRG